MTLAALTAGALLVGLAATPAAIVVARRLDIVDRPGELKSQAAPVPYLGGAAVFAGTAVGVLAGRPSVLIPLAAALVLGVADDRADLPAVLRLAGEVGVGVMVAVTCPVRFTGVVALILVVVVTVVLINGVNLLDGLDLLAGGVVAVAAVGFAVLLHGSGRQMAAALAAALLGFLVFNRPPARVYLGDGGSYLLGTALVVLLAGTWGPHVGVPLGTAALSLVAVPVAEVSFAVVRRLRGRRSVLAGDRGHPYDQLVERGWSRLSASGVYIAVEVVLAAAAVVVAHHAALGATIALDLVAAAALLALAAATGALSPRPGGHRVTRIYLSPPEVGAEERRMLLEAFDSNWIAPIGTRRRRLRTGIRRAGRVSSHAVALSSGTAALHLALLLVGVGPGDEVLVPSFTFVATAAAVHLPRGRSRLRRLLALDLEHRSRPGRRGAGRPGPPGTAAPAAVITVDLYGQAADYDPLASTVRRAMGSP